ncbi:alpha/beta fold hydrolase [Paenibacillus sp.]|jgi:surfactin synthase thioesterase subunit|uniref:thioesterase II family protein n=1 Tax=Paenibacillus sp. TaxID=58172 RepID=UPI00281FF4F1|nr:alpha/beta fold hydrolase [Paenibacillus sp.]MDR0267337.1 thioesterase [Paenibacillus sp.]
MDTIKLFCIPYAGGSAEMYNKLKPHIHSSIEVVPIELAGRGRRRGDPFYSSVEEAAEDVFRIIRPDLMQDGYAFFGHSMGALILYETLAKIQEAGLSAPAHVFVSARRPPSAVRKDKKVFHLLPDKDFIEELMRVGGEINKFLDEPALLEYFMPIIRADYSIIERYVYREKGIKVNCGLSVLFAQEDAEVTEEEMRQWRSFAGESIRFYPFAGGHFYLFQEMDTIARIIFNTLTMSKAIRHPFGSYG